MNARFLGRIPFAEAIQRQNEILQSLLNGGGDEEIIGFETDPVITLGVRASKEKDLQHNTSALMERGFSVENVDRGGQATIHNPGQLVIFPVCRVGEMGVKTWVESLAQITQTCLRQWNIESRWEEKSPGLYTSKGKIMACGVRVRKGVSTHGIALNVNNRLADFALIRACGIENSPMDSMGAEVGLERVFECWIDEFRLAHC